MAGDPARTRRDVTEGDVAPLILTARLPDDLHAWATALRGQYFPPERNYLAAHVTLFHALPPQCADELGDLCKRLTAQYGPPKASLLGVMPLGKGTALKLESAAMLRVRDQIAAHFHGMLTAQDSHGPRLHITIQNKVSIEAAKSLQAHLSGRIEMRSFAFKGLELHRYRGGPWELVRGYTFRGRDNA